jgi:hypothetical protein
MDVADRAQAEEERARSVAASARKSQLKPAGNCHNCGEFVKSHMLFCDKDCRDDYEQRREAKERSGAR